MNLNEELKKALEELNKTLIAKEQFNYKYEMEKARMMFSAEVTALGNQTQRDAQTKLLLDEKGYEKNYVEVNTAYRIAYYKWATIKSMIDGNRHDNEN